MKVVYKSIDTFIKNKKREVDDLLYAYPNRCESIRSNTGNR